NSLQANSFIALSPQVGDCVSFLPTNSAKLFSLHTNTPVDAATIAANLPVMVLYKSEWPQVAPVLKAGETLTFQGGEYHADHPTSLTIDNSGQIQTIQTPGLPQVLAFASGEVVFDSLNPFSDSGLWESSWTARATQVLDKRSVPLAIGKFPPEL